MSIRAWAIIAAIGTSALVRTSIARAEKVHSYAYVTAVKRYQNRVDLPWHCRIGAQLPKDILARAPSGASPVLLEGSTYVSDSFYDPDSSCNEVLHTWLPATFDPSDRASASLTWAGHGFWYTARGILVLLAIFAVIGLVLKRRSKKAAAKATSGG